MTNPKFPPGYNVIQSFFRTYKSVKDPIGTMEESMGIYSGTYSVNLGRKKLIATQDPGFIDHVLRGNHKNYHKSPILTHQLGRFIGNGLLTSNGDYWLKQRRLIQPGFHAEKIHALYTIIQKTVDDFLLKLPTGNAVNVYPLMNSLAFEIVVNTLFNVKVPQADRDVLSKFINETQDFVVKDIRQPHKSWWFKLSGQVNANMKKAEAARNVLRNIIRERKASADKFNDLLDMLLDARYEDNGEAMTEDQVMDEILILIIAGHETTANALSWSLYLLASKNDELERVREVTKDLDIKSIVMNPDLNAIISESMRLFPPAWLSDRLSLHDDQYKDFFIPKDTIIILFYYGLHRDEQYWENATDFNPQRFQKKNGEKDKVKTYYPFGGGPRLCIGNNFAMAEMAIFLRDALQQFDFTPSGIEPILHPLITLRPDKVVLGVRRRS